MAKKKVAKPDQHKSGFMVRLPEEYRECLEARKRRSGAPVTVILQQIIERDCRRAGESCPQNWPDDS